MLAKERKSDAQNDESHTAAKHATISAIEDLRADLTQARCTYHTFIYRNERVLYDINSGSLILPDEVAFELLHGIRLGKSTEAIAEALYRLDLNCDVASVVSELTSLRRFGFFQLEPLDTPTKRDSAIASYLSHHPRKMMLLVQTSCNLHCTYCYEVKSNFHFSGQKKAMSLQTAIAAVDSLIARSATRPELEITFFGGEPLLNFPIIREVVAYCEREGATTGKSFYYSITTNGVLLTDEIIQFLVAKRFAVMLSLDGPPETSDRARVDHSGKGVGGKATANALQLVEAQRLAGVREAMIRATMSHANHDHRAVEDYFVQRGFKRTMIGSSSGRADVKGEGDLTPEDMQDLQLEMEETVDDYLAWRRDKRNPAPRTSLLKGIGYIADRLKSMDRGARIGCGVGRNMLAHTADGDVYPCHRYVGEKAYKLGTIAEGVSRDRLEAYYRGILDVYDTHCSKCWARALCGGQCAHYISRADGSLGPPDVAGCDALRTSFERHLWLQTQLNENDLQAVTAASDPSEEAANA